MNSTWLITQRLEKHALHGCIDVLEHNYLNYFSRFFKYIVPVSNSASFENLSSGYNGIIFTGGGELPNSRLDLELLSEEDDQLATIKYNYQISLLKKAIREEKKILAICYGMTLVLNYFGTKISVNIHNNSIERKPGSEHEIRITDNPIYNKSNKVFVNTYHNQGIRLENLSDEFTLVAIDEKFQIVESAIHKKLPVLCIQWHPERESPDKEFNKDLLNNFLNG